MAAYRWVAKVCRRLWGPMSLSILALASQDLMRFATGRAGMRDPRLER